MAVDDESARNLPLLSYQSKPSSGGYCSLKNAVLLVSLVVNLTLVTTLVTVYGYFWAIPGSGKPFDPQWADAIQAAELAASNLCSGNGDVFGDTIAVKDDGTPACECHVCFTGADCSVSVPDCIADMDRFLSFTSRFCIESGRRREWRISLERDLHVREIIYFGFHLPIRIFLCTQSLLRTICFFKKVANL